VWLCVLTYMDSLNHYSSSSQLHDKQLQGISLDSVLEKRRLDQALNAKEFAVCAGMSYSIARSWFRLPGFPVLQGVVFWSDFVQWRAHVHGLDNHHEGHPQNDRLQRTEGLPPRAARILHEAP